MKRTGIGWTDVTWNPVTGCDRVSPGCDHCYALTTAARMKRMGVPAYQKDGPEATSGPGFGVTLHRDRLDEPLRWQKPRMVFVNSMSDVFHDEIPDEYIAEMFAVMSMAKTHTFQILTKRHARMRSLLDSGMFKMAVNAHRLQRGVPVLPDSRREDGTYAWPLPNVWMGVTVEDQKWADIRIPALLRTPAAVRFLSCEPLLGQVSIAKWLDPERECDCNVPAMEGAGQHSAGCACHRQSEIHWVIVGGESGKQARPMHPDWARLLRDECAAARVPMFFKQWGEWAPCGPLDPGVQGITPEGKFGTVIRYETGRFPAGVSQISGTPMARVGKKAAGNTLDGHKHEEWPAGHQRGEG